MNATRFHQYTVGGVAGAAILSGWLFLVPASVEAARNCVAIVTAGPGYEVCLTTTLTGNISGPGPKTAGVVASADVFFSGSPIGKPGAAFGMPGATDFFLNEVWYLRAGVDGGSYGPVPAMAGSYTNRVRWSGLWSGQWFYIDNLDSFIVPFDPPAAPSVSPDPSTEGDTLTFSWNTITGATYVVGTDSGPCAFDTCFPGAATSMTSGGYVAGNHWVRVQACNASGCSAFSPQTNFTVRAGVGVPTNLRVTPVTQRHGDTVTVNWDSVSGATYYKLFNDWGQCGGACDWAAQPGSPQAIVAPNTGISPGNHAVWVKACNAASCGNSTLPANFTIQSNIAVFVSQKVKGQANPISITVAGGESFPVELKFTNTGTATWDSAGGYVLRSKNPDGNTFWGVAEVALAAPVASPTVVLPGQTVTFAGDLVAPAAGGTYNFQWQLYRQTNNFGYFGAASAPVSVEVSGPVTAVPIRVQLQIKAKQHLPIQ